MGLRDRIAERRSHHQPCQPCEAPPSFAQPCTPQPLILSTPYATMGTCLPPAPASDYGSALPIPPAADLYRYDGGEQRKRGGSQKDEPTERERKTERELRAARDEIDNLKKQLEQLREGQKELLRRLPRPELIQPGQAQPQPFPRRTSDSPIPFNPVRPGGETQPRSFNPVRPGGETQPRPFNPVRSGGETQPRPFNPPPLIQPKPEQGNPLQRKPWEMALPAPLKPDTTPLPSKPGILEQPKPFKPADPPKAEIRPAPVQPAKPIELPKPGPQQVQPIEGPRPGSQQVKPIEGPRPGSKTVEQLVKENEEILQARVTGKVEQIKSGFDKYMKGEEVRLSRAISTKEAEHPSTSSASTRWLLDQDRENLIPDWKFTKKIDDVGYKWTTDGVISSENELVAARAEQWEQVRSNAANKQDPNMETKQALLHEIMTGQHLDGRKFGRTNDSRGDSPLKTDKEQMQVEAAEAQVKANGTAGINHDFTTRSIIAGLRGEARKDGSGNVIGAYLPVPEKARIKLLDAIVPMSNDTGNPFLDGKPKDVALAAVVTALDRSHVSGRPEETFQMAAINKAMELKDPRALGIMEKLSTESSMPKVKALATQKVAELRKLAAAEK